MAKAKTKVSSRAAIAMRAAAAELERQAAKLRAEADLVDGVAAKSVKPAPKKAAKKSPRKSVRKVARKSAKKVKAAKAAPVKRSR